MGYKRINKDKRLSLLESSNVIFADLRESKWLYNPLVYSQISGDFTLMQQRILLGIVEKLQQRIIDSVAEKEKNRTFPDIFDYSSLMQRDTLDFTLSAVDLGVGRDHYDDLEDAAKVLSSITMKYPVFDGRGRISKYVVASLFPRIELPKSENEIRRTGMLRIVMLTENIREIFTMQYGYVMHLSHIARICNKKRTPRLYIYLSRYRDIGHKKVPYTDLLEFLGLTDEYFRQTNEGKNPYNNWSNVRIMVLDPVKKEMDKLMERGEIDFSFEYSSVYPAGKKRGAPDEVEFVIKKGQLALLRDANNHRASSEIKFIDSYVAWCPELSAYALRMLMSDMDDNQLQSFLEFAYKDMRRIVERKQPDDVAAYVMGVLRKWKRDYQTRKEQRQTDLFGPAIVPSVVKDEQPAFVSGALSTEWQDVLTAYGDGLFASLLHSAKHIGSYLGNINVEFATKEERDTYLSLCNDKKNQSEYKRLISIIKKAIGRKDSGVCLITSVLEKK